MIEIADGIVIRFFEEASGIHLRRPAVVEVCAIGSRRRVMARSMHMKLRRLLLPRRDSNILADSIQFLRPHLITRRIHQASLLGCIIRPFDIRIGAARNDVSLLRVEFLRDGSHLFENESLHLSLLASVTAVRSIVAIIALLGIPRE